MLPRTTPTHFLLVILLATSCNVKETPKWFDHHNVSVDLPNTQATRFGTPAIADFDNDGDIDFALSVTRGPLYWFEYKQPYEWDKHEIGSIPTGQLGGGAFDVDNDGWQDIVAGGIWFKNSQNPRELSFEPYQYDSTIDREIHDLVFTDINGDSKKDLVVLGDGEGCFWYELPDDPIANVHWKRHLITLDVLDDRSDIHGGFFPGGINDIDMDGDPDVVLAGRWYRNLESGMLWEKESLPFGSSGYWGLSARSWIIDMDHDGDNDIVMVGCDQLDSRSAWLESNGKPTPQFKVHLLPLTAPGRRGSFHSLWVADFDGDNDADIFTMEQEDHNILPTGAGMRAYIWENLDGKGGHFIEHVVLDKNIGGHDVKFADVDGDGDLDGYFKIWKALTSNSFGGQPHVDFLENVRQR